MIHKYMTITINDIEITLKYGFRAQMIYERIANETFQPTSLNNILLMFYSVIIASNKDIAFTFDEFIDTIDKQPNLVMEFTDWLGKEIGLDKYINQNNEKETKKGKTPKKA